MDTQAALDGVKQLIADVQKDPEAARAAIVKARDALATAAQLLTHLQLGQVVAAQAIVTGMEDVDRANQAAADMAALNANDTAVNALKAGAATVLADAQAILEKVGPLVPIALAIAAAVA